MKRVYCMAAFSIFCWGTMAPISKLLLSDLGNMEVLGYGSAIASVTLFAVLLISGQWRCFREYSFMDFVQLAAIGTVGYFLYSAFYYEGLAILPAQTACILNYLWPVFTVCLSNVILKEPLSLSKLAALFISFLGTAAVMFRPGGEFMAGKQMAGYLCCILAALLYAFFNVLNKKKGGNQRINMFIYISVSAVLALFCCAGAGFTIPVKRQIPGLLWLGICIDALGFLMWAEALQQSKTVSLANAAYMTPVVSLVLSAVLLHEPIYITSVIGLVLILGGFFMQLLYAGAV
ncbi:MAG: DMT family transporter [Lachnospiraceae bacterium]